MVSATAFTLYFEQLYCVRSIEYEIKGNMAAAAAATALIELPGKEENHVGVARTTLIRFLIVTHCMMKPKKHLNLTRSDLQRHPQRGGH